MTSFSKIAFRLEKPFLTLNIITTIKISLFHIYNESIYHCLDIQMNRLIKTAHSSLLTRLTAPFSEIKKFENSFLTTTNLAYIESLYEKWQQDKSSVSSSFSAYFELLEQGEDPNTAHVSSPKAGESIEISTDSAVISRQLKVRLMIDRFRTIGHHFAQIDPLELKSNRDIAGKLEQNSLHLSEFGFTPNQYEETVLLNNFREDGEVKSGPYTVKAMQEYLKKVYSSKVGYEYMHLLSKEERSFIKEQIENNIESLESKDPTKEERKSTFNRLCHDQCFIDFLGNKFANFKRFGIEGLNAGTSALGALVEATVEEGFERLFLGMAHRGRLNTLHCVFEKPAQTIFNQFLEKTEIQDDEQSAGDVKYHLGYKKKRRINGKDITLEILANPSHLEAVNPCVYGSVKAMQETLKDHKKQKVVGVLIHGDAAVAGQGIVYQSLEMHDLVDYSTGGIIHLVYNNSIGFTTNPKQGRSSYYCTEVAKAVNAPVFHVNANEPDILDRSIKIAAAYRAKFKKDIFIDIVGFRRYGHNEQDQPLFTQPLMYEKIKDIPSVYETYSNKMIKEGVLTAEEVKATYEMHMKKYMEDYTKVLENRTDQAPAEEEGIPLINSKKWGTTTGVPQTVLNELFSKITTYPKDFNIHPTIKKIYNDRINNYKTKANLDWATMESLAFATVLEEGYSFRLSGQDVERGTFSHRHAYISDQERDVEKYLFLKAISPNITISNSHLSEYGVLGFEYGYNVTNPNCLTIWEAQFGDFANGASIMIDNFIVSGESKWNQQSGLVLNLPHGMDGQGPEHSSARMERFLQLSDDNCDVVQNIPYEKQLEECNIQVVGCSITSNYFHALRRQLRRDYRKPLILFNSKKLLKYRGANRPLSDITQGTEFQPVLADQPEYAPKNVRTVLLCNGQFYYQLKDKRQELKRKDIAIVRIEQIAPFPHEQLKKVLSAYGSNVDYYWAQEEHENYGAWNFLYPRLNLLLGKKVNFFGRSSSAATAVGMLKVHKKENAALLEEIFA